MRQNPRGQTHCCLHNFLDVCERRALVDVLELLAEVCQHHFRLLKFVSVTSVYFTVEQETLVALDEAFYVCGCFGAYGNHNAGARRDADLIFEYTQGVVTLRRYRLIVG